MWLDPYTLEVTYRYKTFVYLLKDKDLKNKGTLRNI